LGERFWNAESGFPSSLSPGACSLRYILLNARGGIAQLGERLLCKQDVRGSSPLASTISTTRFFCCAVPLLGNIRLRCTAAWYATMLLRKTLTTLFAVACAVAALGSQKSSHPRVEKLVADILPTLGHRNWIVVADSAYPMQTSPGVETITVTESQISCVRQILQALAHTKHVRPHIMLDKELNYVPEGDAPGISKFRKELDQALAGQGTVRMLHEDIIKMLDDAGKTFKVLIIKTPLTMPYTSVFFQLQCGYWSDPAENRLRERMKSGN
jgi:D-ribose pyranose/furanose isomerase RbsD